MKLRTASSLQPWIIHYEQITSPLADGEKSADRALFIAVIVLLVIYAQKVDWQDVWKVIRGYDRLALFSAIALVIVSYLIYGCYDLLGRAYCGHKLAKRRVMLVSFICYAFNLTLSTWVGGIGMRYRLYSRLGLNGSTITRIFSLSITTNWLGYILLGGVIFTADLVKLPPHWYISQTTLRIIGGVMLILTLCYLFGCAFAKRRHLTIKGQRLVLPSGASRCCRWGSRRRTGWRWGR